MESSVALSHLELYLPTKRDLLLFDRIELLGLDETLSGTAASSHSLSAETMHQLSWLAEKGAIRGTHVRADASRREVPGINRDELSRAFAQSYVAGALKRLSRNPEQRRQMVSSEFALSMIGSSPYGRFVDPHILMEEAFRRIHETLAHDPSPEQLTSTAAEAQATDLANIVRVARANRHAVHEVDAIPILPAIGNIASGLDAERAVLNIALTALPEPDEATPWEAVLEFRADPQAQQALARLRRWLMRGVLEAKDPQLLNLELADSLEKYAEHMRLHRIKANTGVLQTLVTLTADVLDSLLHVRIGDASRAIFAFRDRKIALLEAEMSAPGREIAYIARATEAFGNVNR